MIVRPIPDLIDVTQFQMLNQVINAIKKLVVAIKLLQHLRVDQQRGFDIRVVLQ